MLISQKIINMFYYDLHMTNNELGVKSTCQLLLGVDKYVNIQVNSLRKNMAFMITCQNLG